MAECIFGINNPMQSSTSLFEKVSTRKTGTSTYSAFTISVSLSKNYSAVFIFAQHQINRVSSEDDVFCYSLYLNANESVECLSAI